MTTSGSRNPSPHRVFADPVLLLAFGFGSGLVPRGPGTAGTLLAAALFPLLAVLSLPAYGLFLVAAIALGSAVAGAAANRLGVHDHGGIVIDEMAGFWLALFGFPPTIPWMAGGFVLFRLFDIWKPWPIGVLDRRIRGGFGIMLDDLLAGALTWLILTAVKLGLVP